MKGQVARWVAVNALSMERPAEEQISGADRKFGDALKDSDNFGQYKKVFIDALRKLVAEKAAH